MQGSAEVSSNAATNGGGVCVGNGTFRIANGTVYGSNASPTDANTASTNGDALYVNIGTAYDGSFSGNTWMPGSSLVGSVPGYEDNTIYRP
jgi:hypothetical protein